MANLIRRQTRRRPGWPPNLKEHATGRSLSFSSSLCKAQARPVHVTGSMPSHTQARPLHNPQKVHAGG